MCGRYSLASSSEQVAELFGLNPLPPVLPRFNIAPSQPIATIRMNLRGDPEFAFAIWGLIPIWANNPNEKGPRPINARAETVAEKRMFKGILRHKRCLIPADGFYEWRQEVGRTNKGSKQPFHIHFANRRPFAFAGLWSQWNGPNGEEIDSCTILTTAANTIVKAVHNRMPVILAQDCYDDWLNPQIQSAKEAIALLQRTESEPLLLTEVSSLVNNPRNDVQECIEPLTTGTGQEPE
ncbi:MAG: SOS response-associated peptidase [Cyanobacteria bacterium P01_E01_bin.45]